MNNSIKNLNKYNKSNMADYFYYYPSNPCLYSNIEKKRESFLCPLFKVESFLCNLQDFSMFYKIYSFFK